MTVILKIILNHSQLFHWWDPYDNNPCHVRKYLKSSNCLLPFQHQTFEKRNQHPPSPFLQLLFTVLPRKSLYQPGFSFLTWFTSVIIKMFLSSFKLHDSRLLLISHSTPAVGQFPSSLQLLFNCISPRTSSQAVSLISLLWQASVHTELSKNFFLYCRIPLRKQFKLGMKPAPASLGDVSLELGCILMPFWLEAFLYYETKNTTVSG